MLNKSTNLLKRVLDYLRVGPTHVVVGVVVILAAMALYINCSSHQPPAETPQFEANETPPWKLGFGSGARPWTIEGKGVSTSSAPSGGAQILKESGDGVGVYRFVGGLTQGQIYQIEAFTRSDAGTKGQAVFWIHDTTGTHLIWAPKHTPMSNDWEKVTLNFTATSTCAVAIHLYYSGGPGAIYWREVGIVKE